MSHDEIRKAFWAWFDAMDRGALLHAWAFFKVANGHPREVEL